MSSHDDGNMEASSGEPTHEGFDYTPLITHKL